METVIVYYMLVVSMCGGSTSYSCGPVALPQQFPTKEECDFVKDSLLTISHDAPRLIVGNNPVCLPIIRGRKK